ncbi:MAG: response regulator [Proteobacteria bacterium]|nr:response regulator [Pseudomonadota bacterium]
MGERRLFCNGRGALRVAWYGDNGTSGKVDQMRASFDPLGRVLVHAGALTEEGVADVLALQRRKLCFGSLCYVLGYVEEEPLARALSRQHGVPSVVLDRSVIDLKVLRGVDRKAALQHNMLPVHEDEHSVFIAAEDPSQLPDFFRDLVFLRGKKPVLHVALQVTLARTMRVCLAARDRGDQFFYGPGVDYGKVRHAACMVVVSELEPGMGEPGVAGPRSPALIDQAVVEEVTRELDWMNLWGDGRVEVRSQDTTGVDESQPTVETESYSRLPRTEVSVTEPYSRMKSPRFETDFSEPGLGMTSPDTYTEVIPLESADSGSFLAEGPKRALIVDSDLATRNLLVKTLQPLALVTITASTGAEAIRQLEAQPPEVVIIDAMLPDMDGFQLYRAVNQRRQYKNIAVILTSAGIGFSDQAVRRYQAEAYFEKPLDTESIKRRIKELLQVRESTVREEDGSFERAIQLYKAGDIDGSVEFLRAGLKADPHSAKHHFVLANLLQKKARLYEAIDAYEATIDLKPDYFPALTRLAYLYYKQGYSAKAIEMWRRSLPHCPDNSLRHNIETFMRKLIAEMHNRA